MAFGFEDFTALERLQHPRRVSLSSAQRRFAALPVMIVSDQVFMRLGPLHPPHLLVAEEALLSLIDGAWSHPTERFEDRTFLVSCLLLVQEGQIVRFNHVILPEVYFLDYLHHSVCQE